MELISQVTIDDSVYLATDLIELASKKEKLSDKRRKSQFSRLLNYVKYVLLLHLQYLYITTITTTSSTY